MGAGSGEFLKEKASVYRSTTAAAYGYSLDAFARVVKPDNLNRIDVRRAWQLCCRSDGRGGGEQKRSIKTCGPFGRFALGGRATLIWLRFHPLRRLGSSRMGNCRSSSHGPNTKVAGCPGFWNDELTKRPAAWWSIFTRLAYGLGTRRGEILGLRWESVDLEKAELTVLSETSKGRRCRTLPLVPELVAALRGWRGVVPW